MLKQALSSSQAYIFEERDRLLQLQAENDELRLQEVEDRQRLQHLLTLLEAQKGHKGLKSNSAAAKAKESAAADGPSAADMDVLRMRVESLQSQLTEQVGGSCMKLPHSMQKGICIAHACRTLHASLMLLRLRQFILD